MSNISQSKPLQISANTRIKVWYWLLLAVISFFVIRLFYLQVIRYDYYSTQAYDTQLKEYEISPDRGVIEIQNGDSTIPIVLNQTLFTLYADPVYVENPGDAATKITEIIGGQASEYESELRVENTRYVVLAKKLSHEQSQKLRGLELKGIGTRGVPYRTYPQGNLAAQLLGFVNDEGKGSYGIEQALNDELSGTPGMIKAITDARGVPLAGNDDNIAVDPVPGQRTVLSIDLGMQNKLEQILKNQVTAVKSQTGSALIMEARTGKIKAMASYPTYNPEEFYKVENADVFVNGSVSTALEIGSIMKPLTLAAALDQGVVNKNTSYYDPGFFRVGDATVRNVEEVAGSGTRSVGDILRLSLNTGATWLLMQMGGGEINEQARSSWYDYMVNHYGFGAATGIEQGFEASGYVPSPTEGFGLDIQFANTSFGQGMRATPLQMAAALAAVVNGGQYYQPQLIEGTYDDEGIYTDKAPHLVNQQVVSANASNDIRGLMADAFSANFRSYGLSNLPQGYTIGGKTGTAEVPNLDSGGYYDDRYNGTFMGYVGGDEAQYVIIAYTKEPTVDGYAGTKAAGPIFVQLASMLIDDFAVTPIQE